jgi:hypothetical protein
MSSNRITRSRTPTETYVPQTPTHSIGSEQDEQSPSPPANKVNLSQPFEKLLYTNVGNEERRGPSVDYDSESLDPKSRRFREYKPSISGRVAPVKKQQKKEDWPKTRAAGFTAGTTVAALAGGTTTAAVQGAVQGGMAAKTVTIAGVAKAAGGGALHGVATIGGAVGATSAGAAAAAVAPVAAGAIFGAACAINYQASKGDYRDIQNTWTNKFQRSAWFAWARFLHPKSLLKGLWRAIPLSQYAGMAIRARKTKATDPTIQKADPGRDATAQEAREDFRFAVASGMAYQDDEVKSDSEFVDTLNSSSAYKEHIDRLDRHYEDFRLDPKDNDAPDTMRHVLANKKEYKDNLDNMTDSQLRRAYRKHILVQHHRDLGRLNKYEKTNQLNDDQACKKLGFMSDKEIRKTYEDYQKRAVRYQSISATLNHPGTEAWNYSPLHPSSNNNAAQQIANNTSKSLQASLWTSSKNNSGWIKDPNSGLRMRINFDSVNNEVVIGFCGSSKHEHDFANASNLLGGLPPSVKQACNIGKEIRAAVAKYNHDNGFRPNQRGYVKVVSTGHSLGGMLATAEATANGGEFRAFNPEAMGESTRAHCDLLYGNTVKPGTKGVVYGVRNDALSGGRSSWWAKAGRLLGAAIGTLWSVPKIYGERREMDSAPGAPGAHPDPIAHMAHLAAKADPGPNRGGGRDDDEDLLQQAT